jgi:glycine C-acetyltransferase
MAELSRRSSARGQAAARAIVVTDGIFSMRGDHAPLDEVMAIAQQYDDRLPENVVVVVDDSHGVGAFGAPAAAPRSTRAPAVRRAGRHARQGVRRQRRLRRRRARRVDPVPARDVAHVHLLEPDHAGEASAALAALELLDSPAGRALLEHLRALTEALRGGLVRLGFESSRASTRWCR